MARKMLQYRGSLKSCNYSCSYCPFAKRAATAQELTLDRAQWDRFLNHVEAHGEAFGAVMVVPHGEALIHGYYWEGLARLSRLSFLEAVGAQTNLSFPTERQLRVFREAGGEFGKLRLWATFHPEMTTVSEFAERCERLLSAGIRLCAGAVGVPENIEAIRALREALPRSVYVWINRMDGLNRRYSEQEINELTEVDPWFVRELHLKKADPSMCRDRLFVEAGGQLRLCAVAPLSGKNFFDSEGLDRSLPTGLPCRKKVCTCFLAYGGRRDFEGRRDFGRWPSFRIPWQPRAVFFDLDGTLLSDGEDSAIGEGWLSFFRREAQQKFLFLATSRPQKEAEAKCREILPYLTGGIYACGAHVVLYGAKARKKQELFHTFETEWLPSLLDLKLRLGFRPRIYCRGGACYKITLLRPKCRPWKKEELSAVAGLLPAGKVRLFAEEGHLQIVANDADKGNGVRTVCRLLAILPADTAAVGNGLEDLSMFQACGFSAVINGCSAELTAAADYVVPPHSQGNAVR